jgi:multisubunit Na+/H+ antiporter MnhB subunit
MNKKQLRAWIVAILISVLAAGIFTRGHLGTIEAVIAVAIVGYCWYLVIAAYRRPSPP